MRMVDEAGLLLVTGSSLAVFSGYRFVQRAVARAIPLAIVNLGPTRADSLARLRIEGRLGDTLTRLVAVIEGGRSEENDRGPDPGGGSVSGNVV